VNSDFLLPNPLEKTQKKSFQLQKHSMIRAKDLNIYQKEKLYLMDLLNSPNQINLIEIIKMI
jgi:hypothetical protein